MKIRVIIRGVFFMWGITAIMEEFMVYKVILAAFLILSAVLFPMAVVVAETEGRGLFISPLSKEMEITAGKTASDFFTVANLTDKPMIVNLAVNQFSVKDYSYDHTFFIPEVEWVKLKNERMQLEPNQHQKVWYDVTVPDDTASGGYYFSLIAGTTTKDNGGKSTVQAVMLMYLTVDGAKAKAAATLQNEAIPMLALGSKIPYKFDASNTGNVHFKGYFYARLEGLFGAHAETGVTRMLLPGTTRAIEGSIPSPILPGIYQLTYGYRSDAELVTGMSKTATVIYIPPWSVIALILVVMIGWWLRQKGSAKRPA